MLRSQLRRAQKRASHARATAARPRERRAARSRVPSIMLIVARAVAACGLAAALALGGPAHAAEQGSVIFEAKCAACHEAGGNVLQGRKTLFPGALAANGYDTQAAIADLLVNGKGQMPKYQGAIPEVSKLSDEDIRAVADYVLVRAAAEWK